MEYSTKERFFLWILAAIGFFGLNIAFGYGLLFQPEIIMEALKNPIAVAFICEAFLITVALGYLLPKWGVTKLRCRWVACIARMMGLPKLKQAQVHL